MRADVTDSIGIIDAPDQHGKHGQINRRSRMTAYFATILMLLLCMLSIALWYVNNNQSSLSAANFNFAQSLLVALITSVVATTFMGAIYWFLLPKEKSLQQMREIDPQTTIEYFDDALKSSSFWGYHGHIGRWLRNAAFPALINKAREKGELIKVDLVILDPANLEACNVFASYGNAIKFREKKKKSANDIRAELFATMLKAIIANQSDSIEIHLYVSSTFSSLRKDISDGVVFLTRVDPRAPALMVVHENTKKPIETMYSMLRTEFEFTKKQSREVPLSTIQARISENSSIEELGGVLVSLGFFPSLDNIGNSLLGEIFKLIKSEYHPYH